MGLSSLVKKTIIFQTNSQKEICQSTLYIRYIRNRDTKSQN